MKGSLECTLRGKTDEQFVAYGILLLSFVASLLSPCRIECNNGDDGLRRDRLV